MHAPQMKQRLEADGSEPAEYMTPADLRTTLAHEYVEIEREVKRLNIKID